MKKEYAKPEVEVIDFSLNDMDIITTSGGDIDSEGWINPGGNLGGNDGAEESGW